jgi:heme oxygenase
MLTALREQTAAYHLRLQTLPYFKALASAELPLASYVGQLRALAIVHAALERALNQSTFPAVTAVWCTEMQGLPLLEDDLASFRARGILDVPEATGAALEWAQRLRALSLEDPACLLGHLYVLEGSTLGAVTLRQQVAHAFDLRDAQAPRYLSRNEGHEKRSFSEFGGRLEAVTTDEATTARVVAAARESFEYLLRIFAALYPLGEGTLKPLATSLNPEAGAHPIPTDAREIEAAIRAGEKCLQKIPYFEARYGDRGRRFTSSDSAWLVTLSALEDAQATEQVFWLGRVLAARGMPRLTLQVHLELLFEELVNAVPARRERYETLQRAAGELHKARRRRIDDALFESLSTEFEVRVGPDATLRGAGALLVAAVADEADGVPNAVASLEDWMTDAARFALPWIEAVRATLAKGRDEVHRGR